jgi:hypothetical protein
VETAEGYVYSPSLQKVKNIPNEPLTTLPQSGEDAGAWFEVTVPYVNLTLENPQRNLPGCSMYPRHYGACITVR